jgi:t-SNARE complex subunit (syntaxin)
VKERPEIGFIAQEVEKVIPEVIGQKVVNDEEVKSINYGKLTTVLVGAIQEQQKQIQELKETVSKLSTGCQKCSGSCYTG